MSRLLSVLALAALLFPSASSARPRIAPGDWSTVDRQAPGTRIVVELVGGEEIPGALARVAVHDLAVAGTDGETRSWPKSIVLRVWTAGPVRDSVKDGSAKGALIGAGIAAVAVFVAYSRCKEGCEAPSLGGPWRRR
jgi:hypothetical protein